MYRYLLIFIVSFSFAQKPFSKEYPSNILALKACGYINLLDGGYGSILGVEKSFMKNQSLGVKFIYNVFTPNREDTENDYESIDYTNDKDVSLVAEYKYYMGFLRSRDIAPYVSLSYKTGKRTIDNDEQYPHDYYHRETKYNLFGPAIGALFFGTRWGIDTQISYLIGQKDRVTQYVVPSDFLKKETFTTNLIRFEIMVTYNIDW